MRALVAVALASACLVAPPARGEPCPASTVMRAGAVAPCSGVLVPGRRAAQCIAVEHELAACGERLAGEVEARRIADEGWRAEVERLDAALVAERLAAQTSAAPSVRTDWGAVAWGVVAGLVVGALAVGVPVALAR
jgi:hypothetical protein